MKKEVTAEKPICEECGSDGIVATANVYWDATLQDWSISCVFDDRWCNDCEGETSDEWVEVTK